VVIEGASTLVLNYIHREKMGVGDQLPAEVDMAQHLGLSRNSVREAYVELIAKGLIRRKHGVGTFVAEPPILNSLGGTVGFWSLIESAGLTPSLQEITRGRAAAPKDVAALLGVAAGKPVDRMRWLFLANGQPCILIDHYPAQGIPISAFDPNNGHNALPPLRPYIVIEGSTLSSRTTAVIANAETAGLLRMSEGAALLSGTIMVRSGDGKVALASRSWMVPHVFNSQQVMQLTAPHFGATPPLRREEQTR
jgi:GntR family transcriptional regulator